MAIEIGRSKLYWISVVEDTMAGSMKREVWSPSSSGPFLPRKASQNVIKFLKREESISFAVALSAPIQYKCAKCGDVNCESCDNIIHCTSCDKLTCKDCSSFLKCQGFMSCHKSSCTDCLKKDTQESFKQCITCGKGFCCTDKSPKCKHIEYCYHLEGYVCSDCHAAAHHDVTECNHWQYLPTELQEFLPEFTEEVCFDNLVKFWYRCTYIEFFVPDKEFDLNVYGQVHQARVASLKLAVEYLLQNEDNKAAYMLFFFGLVRELLDRGPEYIVKISEDASGPGLCLGSPWFTYMAFISSSREQMINYIGGEIEWKGWGCERCRMIFYEMLDKVESSKCEIHDLGDIRDKAYEAELKGFHRSSVSLIEISVSNLDSDTTDDWWFSKCTTLAWLLKIYAIRYIEDRKWIDERYHSNLRCPKITPSTKYFRVLHKGKNLFLSSSGKKTIHELGIQQGDAITVGGVALEHSKDNDSADRSKAKAKSSKSKKSKGPKKKKWKQTKVQLDQPLTEEQIMEKHRQAHSKSLTPVLEEMGPLLKEIRFKLNDLSILKLAPKVRKQGSKNIAPPQAASFSLPAEDYLAGKAGRVSYLIIVGEASNLYKTKKSLTKAPATIILDLHGFTKDEAMQKLSDCLPGWVDTAMKGEYPWVIPVDIICGGGTQVLSDTVKDWIQSSRQVANRPKNSHG